MAATNPIGPGTVNISVNVPNELAEKLGKLAKQSGMSRSAYCAAVLTKAAKRKTTVNKVIYLNHPGETSLAAEK